MTYHLNSAGCALAAAAIAGTALTFVSCGGTATSPSSSPPSISLTLSLNPSTVVAGGNTQGTITVTGLQGAAATINIAASSAQATPAPATVAIQAGATSATFTVTTSTVSATTTITLTATLTATVSGTNQTASQTATLTITPQAQPPVSLSSCSMNLASVEGGKSTQGTVTLSGAAPAGGAVVQLSSNDTNNVLTLPTSVTVAASSSSATFTVGTREVGGAFQITITCLLGGSSANAILSVQPAPPQEFVLIDSAGNLAPGGFDIFVNTDRGLTNWLTRTGSEGLQCAYPSGQQFGFVAVVLQGDTTPGRRPGKDMSAYKRVQFQLRGAVGGEIVDVGMKDNTNADDGNEVKKRLTLTSSWQTFSFALSDFSRSDVKRLYVLFELVFEGAQGRAVFFRDVRYVP